MMTPVNFPLYLVCLFLGSTLQMSDLESAIHVQQDSGFYSANVGGNVTLRCFYKGNAVMFYWYKQALGEKPRLMSTFYNGQKSGIFHDEFENDSRFTLDTGNGKNHLTISDLHISDSATYYCIARYGYDLEFIEGATVSVQGSGLNIPALVHQSVSGTIQPGGSVTLNCSVHTGTCDGEHSVYWFKDSGESQPGLMYTHGDRNDQCERKSETQTHTCVYNLPLKTLTLSHVGTYYCAVVSCGHILFGDGTELHFEDHVDSPVSVYFLSGALAFTTILVVVLAYAAYSMNRNSCEHLLGSPVASTPNAEGYQDSENLHYAALKKHKAKRSTRQRDSTQTQCVYSTVRQ